MIAIIPARGGSKGLPGKNVKLLNGKPLIYYTIKAALDSNTIDRTIVSTDDIEIAEIAMQCGAEIPFMRPQELASDHSKAIDAYLYTIRRLQDESAIDINEFTVLLPTSPLRTSDDIDKAIDIYYSKKADSVISVTEADQPIEWHKVLDKSGKMVDFFKTVDNSLNRQDTKKTYIPNGAIYVFDYQKLKTSMNYYNENTYPYIMDRRNSVDIDTVDDFQMAEIILRQII